MLYEKRLLVLSGLASGCVRLERTSAGINAVLSVNNIGGSDFLVIVRDDNGLLTFVPSTLSRPFSFALPASTELSRITVIVAAGERLLLSGTLKSERLWQGNLEDEIKRARKLLGQRPPKRSVSDFFFDIMTPETYDDNRVAEVNYYRSNLSVDKDDIAAALSFGAPFDEQQPPPKDPPPSDDTYEISADEDFEIDESESVELKYSEYIAGDFAVGTPETKYDTKPKIEPEIKPEVKPELKPEVKKDIPSAEFAAAEGVSFAETRDILPPPENIPPGLGGQNIWVADNNAPPYTGRSVPPPPEMHGIRPSGIQPDGKNIRPSGLQSNGQSIRPSGVQSGGQSIRPSGVQQDGQSIRPPMPPPKAEQPPLSTPAPESAPEAPPVEQINETHIVPPPANQPPPVLGSAAFYDTVKPQLEKLFAKNEHYGALERLLPESKWIRVDYDNKGKFYLIGLIGEPVRYICYGVPGKYSPRPPAELAGYCQWLAINENDPIGEGFWVMYQDAVTGKSIL